MEQFFNKIKLLSHKELIILRNNLTFIVKPHTIEIDHKNEISILKKKYKTYTCLVWAPSKYPLDKQYKDSHFKDYIGKIVHTQLGSFLSIQNIERFFNEYLTSYEDIYIFKVKKEIRNDIVFNLDDLSHKFYIETSISKLNIYLEKYPMFISKNTLFLFENISWELIQIFFKSLLIRINGGSHSKRYLISPLDLKLLDILHEIKEFSYTIAKEQEESGYAKHSNEEKEILYKNYKSFLNQSITQSYYLHEVKRIKYLDLIINKTIGVFQTLDPYLYT